MDISNKLQIASVASQYTKPEVAFSSSTQPKTSAFDGPAVNVSISSEAVELFDQLQSLSKQDEKKLDALFEKMDKIFESAGNNELSGNQIKQLDALSKKVDQVLGLETEDDLLASLPPKEAKQLEDLFKQVDQLFEKSGDKPLTESQQKQLHALDEKINQIAEAHV
ncbi:MAG: hypothetical protein OIF58_12450 [Cohaesibacter sp.]|nr:hypothetical protein [Cohaesibacter sp.]